MIEEWCEESTVRSPWIQGPSYTKGGLCASFPFNGIFYHQMCRTKQMRPKTEPIVRSEMLIHGNEEQIVYDNKLATMN